MKHIDKKYLKTFVVVLLLTINFLLVSVALAVTKDEIIKMSKARLSDEVIIN